MRRVWAVYALRQLASPTLRLGVLAATALLLATSVSITNVLANLVSVSGLTGLARFTVSAFNNTEFSVQTLTVLAGALAVWFAVDTIHNLVDARTLKTVTAR